MYVSKNLDVQSASHGIKMVKYSTDRIKMCLSESMRLNKDRKGLNKRQRRNTLRPQSRDGNRTRF